MIDPSGIKPKNDKLIVKEVKPGVYTIENAYEGVHEDFTTSNFDVVESSTIEGQSDYGETSLKKWRKAFGTQERTTIPIEQLDTNTTTEEDTTTKFKNQ